MARRRTIKGDGSFREQAILSRTNLQTRAGLSSTFIQVKGATPPSVMMPYRVEFS